MILDPRGKVPVRLLVLLAFLALLGCGCSRKQTLTSSSSVSQTVTKTAKAPTLTTAEADASTESSSAENSPTTTAEAPTETTYVAYEDADSYYQTNGTLLQKTPVSQEKAVLSEKDVLDTLEKRGLTGFDVTFSYNMNGKYADEKAASSASSDKHPMYEQLYVTRQNEIWMIYVIGGRMMAYSVSWAFEDGVTEEVILSESDTLYSYDSHTNTFYETIPNSSVVRLITVDQINAETLEKYTVEVLKKK